MKERVKKYFINIDTIYKMGEKNKETKNKVVKNEVIKINSNIYFRQQKMNKISKDFFNENIKHIKKLTNNELFILHGYKNNCFSFMNKLLLLHKFPKILNKNSLTSCFIPYQKDKNWDSMNKDEMLLSIYYSINKFDKVFSKMNTLPNIKVYRGIKNPIFNYIQNKKELCQEVNKINVKKLTQNEITSKVESNKWNAFNKLTGFNSSSLLSYSNLKKNDILQYDSYQSTSINPNVAFNFISYARNKNFEKVFLEINIKKENKIPFIFLTDKLFQIQSKKDIKSKSLNEWNKTKYDEFEILLPRNIEYQVLSKKIIKLKEETRGFENYFSNKQNYKEIMYIKMNVLPYKAPKKLDASYFTYLPEHLLV